METMKEYVVRLARQTKDYKRVAEAADVGEEWLRKIAQDAIANPGSERIERCFNYYKRLENRPKAR